jgi:murein DD-endopeptidase MepM/ murein hydrolase activator NlpD
MDFIPRVNRSKTIIQVSAVCVLAALVSACSSDARRVAGGWGSTQSATNDLAPIGGSSGPVYASSAPTSAVQSAPLSAPIQSQQLASPAKPAPAMAAPKMALQTPTSAQSWTPVGGKPVVLAKGESVASLASRNNVPTDVLLSMNGFKSASQVTPGTRLIIPVQPNAIAAAPAVSKIKDAKNEVKSTISDAKSKADSQLAAVKSADKTPAPQQVASAKPAPVQKEVPAKAAPAPAPDSDATASLPSEASTLSETANPEFRWPARGRIILGFKAGTNEGINIAVPEGTSVKAAEAGYVVYAGSELKGYGNLVLIKHPNGFVSAYANNSELSVKRGETVKRGQIIAKSGQSGNVSSPQLHFELRKGSTPVDPTNFLAGL